MSRRTSLSSKTIRYYEDIGLLPPPRRLPNEYRDYRKADVTYIKGRARLTGKNGVEIDGQHDSPFSIIVATGAQPWAPPIPGLAETGYLTSTTTLDLKELPRSLMVLGTNAVGLELAQIYTCAGTYVTLLELLPRIAPFELEKDVAMLSCGVF